MKRNDDSKTLTDKEKELAFKILEMIKTLKPNEAMVISGTELDSFGIEAEAIITDGDEFQVPKKRKTNSQTNQFKQLMNEKEKEYATYENSLGLQTDVPKTIKLRDKIMISDLPLDVKAQMFQKIKSYKPNSEEFEKQLIWIESALKLPFGKVKDVPITTGASGQEIGAFLENARKSMDQAVTGHEQTKNEIVDFLAKWIVNPKTRGSVLGLCGEKGIGKTRLIKKGISEALGLPMQTINFGGLNDSHYLTGFNHTYVSSRYGRIAQILMDTGIQNPIIYLDELDKVADTAKGSEIHGVLMHLLDDEQAHEFEDTYFMGIKLDLSKAIIIASFNHIEKVDPVLLDRIKVIQVKNPTNVQKLEIVTKHILPELLEQINKTVGCIQLDKSTLEYIINSKIQKESGCRKLKQALQTVIFRMNTHALVNNIAVSEENPFLLDSAFIDKVLSDTSLSRLEHAHIYT